MDPGARTLYLWVWCRCEGAGHIWGLIRLEVVGGGVVGLWLRAAGEKGVRGKCECDK